MWKSNLHCEQEILPQIKDPHSEKYWTAWYQDSPYLWQLLHLPAHVIAFINCGVILERGIIGRVDSGLNQHSFKCLVRKKKLKTPEYGYPKSCIHFPRAVGCVIEVTADWLQLLSLKILSVYKGRLSLGVLPKGNQSILKETSPS